LIIEAEDVNERQGMEMNVFIAVKKVIGLVIAKIRKIVILDLFEGESLIRGRGLGRGFIFYSILSIIQTKAFAVIGV
jgi:hypothetical protein